MYSYGKRFGNVLDYSLAIKDSFKDKYLEKVNSGVFANCSRDDAHL